MIFKDYLGEFNKWLAENGYTEFENENEKGSSFMEGFERRQGHDTWEKKSKKDGAWFIVNADGSTNCRGFDQAMYAKYLAPRPQSDFERIWGAVQPETKPEKKGKA